MENNLRIDIRVVDGNLTNEIDFGIFKKSSIWNKEENRIYSNKINREIYAHNILLNKGYYYIGFLNSLENVYIDIELTNIKSNEIIVEYNQISINISPYAYIYVDENLSVYDSMQKTTPFIIHGNLEVENLQIEEDTNVDIVGTLNVKNNIIFKGVNSFINVQKDGALIQANDDIITNEIPFTILKRESRIDVKEIKLDTINETAEIKINVDKEEPYIFAVPVISEDENSENDSDSDSDPSIPSSPLITVNKLDIKPPKVKNTKEEILNKGKVVVVFPPKLKIKFNVLNFN